MGRGQGPSPCTQQHLRARSRICVCDPHNYGTAMAQLHISEGLLRCSCSSNHRTSATPAMTVKNCRAQAQTHPTDSNRFQQQIFKDLHDLQGIQVISSHFKSFTFEATALSLHAVKITSCTGGAGASEICCLCLTSLKSAERPHLASANSATEIPSRHRTIHDYSESS